MFYLVVDDCGVDFWMYCYDVIGFEDVYGFVDGVVVCLEVFVKFVFCR